MPDLQKLNESKERILSTVRRLGPSYPGRIAKETGISSLFVSAFLAELVSDKKLKMSSMKVGSSPLYLIEGQEKDLENFVSFLNHRERDAFVDLKKYGILEDERADPAIRVALRKIKDFAHPLNVRVGGETKLFWKFFLTSDDEARAKIQQLLSPSAGGAGSARDSAPVTGVQAEETAEENAGLEETAPLQEPIKEIALTVNSRGGEETSEAEKERSPKQAHKKVDVFDGDEEEIKEVKTAPKKEKAKKIEDSEFAVSVRDYLSGKDVEVLVELESKKKEFVSKVRIDTVFGKQDFYLVAKEKKKVNSDDLTIVLQRAQSEKMPAILLSPGELDKRAIEHLKEWRNMIKFEKMG